MSSRLNLTAEERDNAIYIRLKGSIDSSNAEWLRTQFHNLQLSGKKRQVYYLNLGQVSFLTSAGLRVLLALKKSAGSVTLCEPNDTVREVFHVTGLDKIFPIVN